MFEIKPNALYSYEDLERELGSAISVRAFLDSYKPVKRSKNLWWGEDLIEAIRDKKPINNPDRPGVLASSPTIARNRGRQRNGNVPIPRE